MFCRFNTQLKALKIRIVICEIKTEFKLFLEANAIALFFVLKDWLELLKKINYVYICLLGSKISENSPVFFS